MFFDIDALISGDQQWKPGGPQFDQRAIQLCEIYEDRAEALTLAHMRDLGVGEDQPHPLTVSILRRVVDALSVLYSAPPTRRLVDAQGREAPDASPEAQALTHAIERAQYDVHWQMVDAARTLYRQAVVAFVASDARQCAQLRVFEPFNVFRQPSAHAADQIDQDQAVALQIRASASPTDRAGDLYQLWAHDDGGAWRSWIVNGDGHQHGDQPWGADGLTPYGDQLPLLQIYDAPPMGQAYLPLGTARVSYALNINALVGDIAYIIRQESHTTPVVSTDDRRGVPSRVGPGRVWIMPDGSNVQMLTTNPKIEAMSGALDQLLRLFCVGEQLPPDTFRADVQIHSGVALKVKERALEARRKRLAPMAIEDERAAYRKLRAVHNAHAGAWGAAPLSEAHDLALTLGSSYQPVDPGELQQIAFADLAIGAASVIDYLQERYGLTRAQALRRFERVQLDRSSYPVAEQQNPGAMVIEQLPGVSAEKTTGAFNPDLDTATEGASVIDAASRRTA